MVGAAGERRDDGDPGAEARAVFEPLAAELEEGVGDPESRFAAHPELEGELRVLYGGWLRVDSLLRGLGGAESLVGEARRECEAEGSAERAEAALARLARSSFEERYERGEELGHGGMGVVWRVTDRALGRELAMKVIRPGEPGRRARVLRRFLEEAEVLGRLEHPGIVPIHELGLDGDGQVYFTMPLIRGRTLQEILRLARDEQEGWTRVRVLELVLRVCETVAYAHSRGVLHRDLKPANVMVGRFGEVFVLDWGLARSLHAAEEERTAAPGALDGADLTLDGEVLGTPAYMAPEQALERSRALDERCDVYALGAILYETVAGERPYGECTSAEALARLSGGAPAAVEQLARGASEELCAILRRAMAREREQRYPSVTALAADLRAFIEGRVVRAHRTGAWIEARKWVQRNRRLALALAVAAATLVGGLVTALVLLRAADHERDNVFRLAQTRTLANLIERAERLWPAHPAQIAEMRAWSEEARALVRALDPDPIAGTPGLRQDLAELRERATTGSEQDRWWHDELANLVAGIEELAEPEHGLLGSGLGPHGFGIGWRLAQAERLRTESERPEVQELWRAARDSIRGDARFAGLELAPQVGLVPLGPDPASGLWEFAHVLSGEPPRRGEDGHLQIRAEMCVVLVLVPGGTCWVGAQTEDPHGHNHDPGLLSVTRPVKEVVLRAFLLSKWEMTQGQWQRVCGANPSLHQGTADDERLPVEQISWIASREELRKLGLRLPGEDEWEAACRAGAETCFFWGNDSSDFPRHANVRDLDLQDSSHSMDPFEPLRDGHPSMAAVGSYLPNPWGFHDMHGNAFEWCEDLLELPVGGPNPNEEVPASRVFRGGSFQRVLKEAGCASRGGEGPAYLYRSIGVRPAMSLRI